ncbi:TIGR03086 family metal-binding protein [Streptomyces sp. NPDC046939]|uniref:TIGR03086 family metal-binding protein n=1 Tax=Streptomyces sp. NPDC046939 TaxID=3155376 RepID=UPI0033EA59E1
MDTYEQQTQQKQQARRMGELLGSAAERAVPVVSGLPDAALTAPTPCAEYDVKALVNHLFQVVVEFRKLAAKRDADFTTTPDRVGEEGDWRERFAGAVEELVAAWSAPGAEEGTSGAMNMPARLVGAMVLLDLTVHAWDLARATGQPYEAPPQVVGVLAEAVAELAPTARSMGVFGEPVPARAGASPFDRLLAATGRHPHQW